MTIANSSGYGSSAGVFTRDITRAHRVAGELQSGYEWISGSSRHYWGLSFRGVKSSGIGREESVDELLSYTGTTAVTVVME